MCGACGCSSGAVVTLLSPGGPHPRASDLPLQAQDGLHAQDGQHAHPHPVAGHDHARDGSEHAHLTGSAGPGRTIEIQQKVLAKNDDIAEKNRSWLRERGILAVNLMSSPGSGKTTLLERTTRALAGKMLISVIEGDQETALDAKRILAVLASVTEGADKPLKYSARYRSRRGTGLRPAAVRPRRWPAAYPHMFRQADLVLLNKTDLLPYVEFDLKQYMSDLRRASPDALLLQLSATTVDGMQAWYDWLRRRVPAPRE